MNQNKKFETKYGYFTEDGKAFVITDYRTPRPWINVISNSNYGLVISQTGGGFSWITHANFNRLTRWQQDLIRDNWGKYIYIRDQDKGDFWSPTVKPGMKALDSYQCIHGIGYSTFLSRYKGIEVTFRLFVPFEDDLEIWKLTVKNDSGEPRKLGIFTYLEWCLGVAPDSHREFHKLFIETEFDHSNQAFLARKRLWEISGQRGHWNVDWNRTAYFACSEEVDGFEGDKETFLGQYRDLAYPLALEKGNLSGQQGKWNDAISSLMKEISLKEGDEKSIYFYLGAEKDPRQITYLLTKYRIPGTIEETFESTRKKWDDILSTTTIETPDEAMNILSNVWLKYQAISGRLWARSAYYQQSGAYGYRDQLQDSQIFLYIQPERTKKQILDHAAHQFQDGRVLHWWHPITDEGLEGNMADDLLWLPFITIQYLKETADWDILTEQVSFYDRKEISSLLEHCLQSVELALSRMSKRGLPLILSGDWNDGLNAVGLEGKGESIWLAHFLYYILKQIQPVLTHQELFHKKEAYEQKASELLKAINDYGWDGSWFWRASKDNGELIGSQQNAEGKLFLNPQTWAVIANSTNEERKLKAVQAIEKNLESKVGPLLFYPAFSSADNYIGYLTRYAPGMRENGGVYTHAAVWAVWAECLLKRSAEAYKLLRKICPILNGMGTELYCAEPYVTPGNLDGPDSPHHGRGGWTWYTGSAAWYFRIMIDYVLGVRADYEGLVVDPCLPPNWKTVKIKRYFRGTTYLIQINSTGSKDARVKEIFVEGEKIQGTCIPSLDNRSQVEVNVKMD